MKDTDDIEMRGSSEEEEHTKSTTSPPFVEAAHPRGVHGWEKRKQKVIWFLGAFVVLALITVIVLVSITFERVNSKNPYDEREDDYYDDDPISEEDDYDEWEERPNFFGNDYFHIDRFPIWEDAKQSEFWSPIVTNEPCPQVPIFYNYDNMYRNREAIYLTNEAFTIDRAEGDVVCRVDCSGHVQAAYTLARSYNEGSWVAYGCSNAVGDEGREILCCVAETLEAVRQEDCVEVKVRYSFEEDSFLDFLEENSFNESYPDPPLLEYTLMDDIFYFSVSMCTYGACSVDCEGRVVATNRNCVDDGYGEWVSSGCSLAFNGGVYSRCCIDSVNSDEVTPEETDSITIQETDPITIRVHDGYHGEGCSNISGEIFLCDGTTFNRDLMKFGLCTCRRIDDDGIDSVEFKCLAERLVYPLNQCLIGVDGRDGSKWDLMLHYTPDNSNEAIQQVTPDRVTIQVHDGYHREGCSNVPGEIFHCDGITVNSNALMDFGSCACRKVDDNGKDSIEFNCRGMHLIYPLNECLTNIDGGGDSKWDLMLRYPALQDATPITIQVNDGPDCYDDLGEIFLCDGTTVNRDLMAFGGCICRRFDDAGIDSIEFECSETHLVYPLNQCLSEIDGGGESTWNLMLLYPALQDTPPITIEVNDVAYLDACFSDAGESFLCDGSTLNDGLMTFYSCSCERIDNNGIDSIEFDCSGTRLLYPLNQCLIGIDGGSGTTWDLMLLYPTSDAGSAEGTQDSNSVTIQVNDVYHLEACYDEPDKVFLCDGNTINVDFMEFGGCTCVKFDDNGMDSILFDCSGTRHVYPVNQCQAGIDGGAGTRWNLMLLDPTSA